MNMTKVVRLNESELFNIASKVLNKKPIEKRKETYGLASGEEGEEGAEA